MKELVRVSQRGGLYALQSNWAKRRYGSVVWQYPFGE